MNPWSTAEPFLVLLGTLMVPAVLIFTVFTAMRVRRTKFRRQRIHRGATSRHRH